MPSMKMIPLIFGLQRSLYSLEVYMYHVYLIRSLNYPDQVYIGCTENLDRRLSDHNCGTTLHTAKYVPWKLVMFLAFTDKDSAVDFEKYLKSGSGRAFAAKRLWRPMQ
jgi:putative endonuclease